MPTALHIPDGFGQFKAVLTLAGKTNPITITGGYGTPAPGSLPSDHADAINTYFADTGMPFAEDNTFESVEVVYNDSGVFIGAASSQAPVPGTYSNTFIPIVNASLLVQKKSALVGRHYRGRFFAPLTDLRESDIDPMGNIDVTALGNQQTRWTACWTAWTGGAVVSPVILHQDPTLAPTSISAFTCVGKVATQRRRIRR